MGDLMKCGVPRIQESIYIKEMIWDSYRRNYILAIKSLNGLIGNMPWIPKMPWIHENVMNSGETLNMWVESWEEDPLI
jgi:hypothetical protein